MKLNIVKASVLFAAIGLMAACENRDSMGDKAEDAVEDVEDSLDDAADEARDAVEDAGDSIEDAADEAE